MPALSLLIDVAFSRMAFNRASCRGSLCVFACGMNGKESFPGPKEGEKKGETPWKGDKRGPGLKDKDVCNLRSHVLGISGVSSSDKLVDKLNYGANEPPRVPPERSSSARRHPEASSTCSSWGVLKVHLHFTSPPCLTAVPLFPF